MRWARLTVGRLPRVSLGAVLVAVVFASVALADALVPTPPGYTITSPSGNPDLRVECGLNVILVLDGSGSVDRAGALPDVRNGTKAFIAALNGTGSKLAIVSFASTAEVGKSYVEVTDATKGSLDSYAGSWRGGSWGLGDSTNWDDAFVKTLTVMQDTTPDDLVVFVTDGDPTNWNKNHRHGDGALESAGPTEGSGIVNDVDKQAQGVSNAIDHANVVRRAGTHIFVVAVGQGFSENSKPRIQAISGNDPLGPGGFGDGKADFSYIGFDLLAQSLKKLATDFCASSVKVTKEVDSDLDGQFDDPAGGWKFTGNVSTSVGGYTWREPDEGAAGERSGTTAAGNPTVLFDWLPSNSQAKSTFTLTEDSKPSYRFHDADCSPGGHFDSLPAKIEIGPTTAAQCTVRNKRFPGVNLCHATGNAQNPYDPVYMWVEDGKLLPSDHRGDAGDIIPSFAIGGFTFGGRNYSEAGQVVLQAGCNVPQQFTQIVPTVDCVERFDGGKLRAHFGYDNASGGLLRLTPGDPWNSFSPAPADRGQGAEYLPGVHPDAAQVEFGASATLSWTLGTKTVSASTNASVTPRCQGSITVVKQLNALGGRFDLRIDGEVAGTGASVPDPPSKVGTTGSVAVTAAPAGTPHRVDEAAAGQTQFEKYEKSIRCVWDKPANHEEVKNENGHSLSINVKNGDVVVCTIVNEQQVRPVIPSAECVQPQADGSSVARFGYNNQNAYPVDIDYGPKNELLPNDLDKSQPKYFVEGSGHVFEVGFTGDSLAWHLDGTIATARKGMRLCEALPTLIVKKVVVGSNKPPSDFTFTVAGKTTPFESDGENLVALPAGTYTVTEPAVNGFTTTYDKCEGITLSAPQQGAPPVCTITNTAQQGPTPPTPTRPHHRSPNPRSRIRSSTSPSGRPLRPRPCRSAAGSPGSSRSRTSRQCRRRTSKRSSSKACSPRSWS